MPELRHLMSPVIDSSAERAPVTVAEALVRCLANESVDTVFGVAGGYLQVFLDAMRRGGVKAVTNLHECAAAFSASGYAMASGKLGVVYAQAGPGVTNTLTGISAAFMDSIPLLLLASQAPTGVYARDGHQEVTGATQGIDQLDAFRTATAARYRPPAADSVIRCARRAMASAFGRRLPAALEVAANLLSARVPFDDLPPQAYRSDSAPVDRNGIDRLAELLRRAERPALLIGHRAAHRGLTADLIALCEEQDMPCATVDFAKGAFPEDHPLCLGALGSCGHDSAAAYFESADLVIAIGVRMTFQTTYVYDAKLFRNLVQIDEHPEELGRNFALQLGIVGDIAESVRALCTALGGRIERGSAEIVSQLRQQFRVYEAEPSGRVSTGTPRALAAMREVLPRDTLVVGDSGLTLQYLKHFFPVYAPDGFYNLYSLAPMGSGVPLAIGVQLARPDQVVLCVVGDGGALVHLAELSVATQLQLPIIFAVFNNGGYKQVGDRMERYHEESYACRLPVVDFAAVARACGCDAYRVHDADAARSAVRSALERRRPAVIELMVDGDNLFDITPDRVCEWADRLYDRKADTRWPFAG
jgi:acetolactate synthase-1/2/3 large subunit